MRVNINLASQKYEDVRQFYLRWGVAVAALAALTVLLATLAYLKYSGATEAKREIKDLQEKVDALSNERARLVAFENSPENRDVTQQKKFWNTQLAKRSFSWTQLLNDMQRIMPRRASLDSVQPEITPEGRVKLRLTITGEKREDARELEQKMENSTRFHSTHIVSESTVKGPSPSIPPVYKFEIEAFYVPTLPTLAPAPAPSRRGQVDLGPSRLREGD
jgi:hypothetical protein